MTDPHVAAGQRAAGSPPDAAAALRALGLDGILVINVRGFVERRRHVAGELARFGLAGEFVHVWDADDITPEDDARFFEGTELNPGQKSCALKHVAALERIVARGWTRCLVLEDDVVLAPGFGDGVRAALEETRDAPHPFVVYIGAGGNFYTPASQRVPGRRVYEAAKGRFADSYLLGSQEAGLRLEWIRAHRMTKPIDVTFEGIDRELGIRFLWLEDPVVEQGSKLGVFRTSLEPASPNWLQGLRYRLEKLRRKYLYQLWR